ncbi:uncharacterized protein N7515_006401 [Penicillium bovifimosum]|uniref:Acetamidase/formamidase family protein n=1 Tax=Penicillium bovifimosum TaxID=126998 RepID=A0A9W9GUM9_9EURO|nr:uncharacterized protein N7515_006401 [Penicillium bovifimosum]KAJ5130362.1 hypothetical protein N7515_006401 [Penicillium bovifimosum]
MAPKEWSNFHVGRECGHHTWARRNTPKLTVSSGETVTFDAIDSSNGQLNSSSTASDIKTLDFGSVNPVFGPIYMNDAQPGDVLKVEVLDLEVADWGWSAIIPGFGLLADEFTEPQINIWKLNREAGFAQFKDMRIPLRPFLGCMGLAPASDEELSTVPPTNAGGNMDCRELSVGSTVYLPVQTAGALFSCGDGHAAQGHGEVCGTAIETPIRATLRFELVKNQPWITAPQFQTPPRAQIPNPLPDLGTYGAMGISSDLYEATRSATRNLIQWLVQTKGLTRSEAYIIASVAGDLQIAEVVNVPNFEVAMTLPLGIFS